MENKIKIYAPNTKGEEGLGGGHTFYRNFLKGMKNFKDVEFVNSWRECGIFFVSGITIVDMTELRNAEEAGKKIVLRVDNVPRKSRNLRSSPHERLKEVADMADIIIYQSKWAEEYCKPLCGDGTVIYNGTDGEVFYPALETEDRPNNYLYLYHGKNEQKQFWTAHYHFQMIARKNPKAKFFFVYDFGSELRPLLDNNFDFWNNEKYEYIPKIEQAEEVAELMRDCGTLIYPAICDASPNTVIEARACGMEVIGYPDETMSGTAELMNLTSLSLENMCEDYYGVFKLLA